MLRICLSLAVAAALVATGPPVAAAADTTDVPDALPIPAVTDVVADAGTAYVFVTGTGTTGLLVRDRQGAAVTTLYDGQEAGAIVRSADGTTLYVPLPAANAIAVVDTTTLTETARWDTGANTCPWAVAEVGTRLWFTYNCGNPAKIGVLERAGETPQVTLDRQHQYLNTHAFDLLAHGSRLVVDDGSVVHVYDAEGTTLTHRGARAFTSMGGFAFSPDGTQVYVTSYNGLESHHGVYALPALTYVRGFGASQGYPQTVTSGGGFVATGNYEPTDAAKPVIDVWTAAGTAVRPFTLPACCGSTKTRTVHRLAFSGDASTLYAVTSADGAGLHLHTLADATRSASSVLWTKPATPKIKVAYTVAGRFSAARPVPAGETVTVTRGSTYGTATLPPVTTGTNGSFSFSDTVTKRGTYTYRVSWAGDADHLPATGTVAFKVLGLTPSLSLSTNATSYKFGATALVAARLGTTGGNRTVEIKHKIYGQTLRSLKKGTVDGSGYLRGSMTVSRRTTFTAYFTGDETYEPRTVSRTVTVGVHFRQYLHGGYGTSGAYHLVRTTADPWLSVYVSPNRNGTCMVFTAQRYSSGAWRTIATSDCIALNEYSNSSAVLTGSAPAGALYRMRATFVGDTSNARTTGDWKYVRFTT